MNGLHLLFLIYIYLTSQSDLCNGIFELQGQVAIHFPRYESNSNKILTKKTVNNQNGPCKRYIYRKKYEVDINAYKIENCENTATINSKTFLFGRCLLTLQNLNQRFIKNKHKSILIDVDLSSDGKITEILKTESVVPLISSNYQYYENILDFDRGCEYNAGTIIAITSSCTIKIKSIIASTNLFFKESSKEYEVQNSITTLDLDSIMILKCDFDDLKIQIAEDPTKCFKYLEESKYGGTCYGTLKFGYAFKGLNITGRNLMLTCTPKENKISPENKIIDRGICNVLDDFVSFKDSVDCFKQTIGGQEKFSGTCIIVTIDRSIKSIECMDNSITNEKDIYNPNVCKCPEIPFNKEKAKVECNRNFDVGTTTSVQITDSNYVFDHDGYEDKTVLPVSCLTGGISDPPVVLLKWRSVCAVPSESAKVHVLAQKPIQRGQALEYNCKSGDTKEAEVYKATCMGFLRFETPLCVKDVAEPGANSESHLLSIKEIVVIGVFSALTVIVVALALFVFGKMGMFAAKKKDENLDCKDNNIHKDSQKCELIILS